MMKKSKVVALLVVCVMMFAAVEPACARTWGEFFSETVGGSVIGGVLGAAAVVVTGGATLPLVVGGAALGAAVGATPEEHRTEVVTGTIAGMAGGAIVEGMKPQQ
ncbi:MAG: hypothetical protein IJG37_08450 [Synergistaceae bacterium]|nr:hypothetical protein [Synergistaceae bacterium]MBQ7169148.1 hypothetical protein [Synergistaceae bacterium]